VLKDEPISNTAKTILDDVTAEVYVSIASVWEIAIKIGTGKLKYAGGVRAFLDDIKMNEFKLLDIKESHLGLVEELEYHHRDPFDRLLIAAVIADGMTMLTADENIHKYDVPFVW
jgi:PIN domain nuclease of toxin-antitoxin system